MTEPTIHVEGDPDVAGARAVAEEAFEDDETLTANSARIVAEKLAALYTTHSYAPPTRERAIGAAEVLMWVNLYACLESMSDAQYDSIIDELFG